MLAQHFMMKHIITVKGDVTVRRCIEIMAKRHVSSLVVVDGDRRVEGMFTDRDAICVVAHNLPLEAPVKRVMRTNIPTIQKNATIDEVKLILKGYRIYHLPVVDSEGRLVGLFSAIYVLNKMAGLFWK